MPIDLSGATGVLVQDDDKVILILQGKFFGPYSRGELIELHAQMKKQKSSGGDK